MKKTKKALASLAIAGMVLSMAPASVFAADDANRIWDADRYLTSVKVAEKAYTSATTAVIAAGNDENLVDALAAAPLAAQEKAPIYLTNIQDSVDVEAELVKSLDKLDVTKVIIVGAAANDAKTVAALEKAGVTVEKVAGASRIETAELINAKLKNPAGTFVVGYEGVADALSIASYAAANNYKIVVAKGDGTTTEKDVDYILGGPALVKDIAGADRIFGGAGTGRFETNKDAIETLTFKYDTVYVANGRTLADALAVSVLAAQTKSPVLLSDGSTVVAANAAGMKMSSSSKVVALGGTGVVSDAALNSVKYVAPATLAVESVSAINLNQIKVVFNNTVDADTAENEANYLVGGTPLVAGTDVAKLQSDDKTVLITLNSPQLQYAKTWVTVTKAILSEDLLQTAPRVEQELTFTDTTVPTVVSAKASGNSEVTVKFSEPIKLVAGDALNFKINDQNVVNYSFVAPATVRNATASNYSDTIVLNFGTALPTGTSSLTVPAGTSTNLVDAAGFMVAKTTVNFTVDSVTSAPKVTGITGSNNGTVYVTFDRAMKNSATGNGALNVANYDIGDGVTNPLTASFKSGTSNTVVKLTFAAGKVALGGNILVLDKDMVDTYGNKIDGTNDVRVSYSATEDKAKPTVANVTLLSNTKVRVKFSETVNYLYAQNLANYKLKDSAGTDISSRMTSIAAVPTVNTNSDTFDITLGTALEGSNYSLTIKNIVDTAYVPNTMDAYTASISGSDTTGPIFNEAVASSADLNKVIVYFNEAMDSSSVGTLANYAFTDGTGDVRALPSGTTLNLGSGNKTVEIVFPSNYTTAAGATTLNISAIRVANVKDVAGNVLGTISTTKPVIAAAAATAVAPDFVANSFKLYATGDNITAEIEYDRALRALVLADFSIAGNTADSGYLSGNKVVLTFTGAKATAIKALGVTNAVAANPAPNSADAAGVKIKAIAAPVTVYSYTIAPKLASTNPVVVPGGANTVVVNFDTPVDASIAGLYLDDFTFMNNTQGRVVSPSSVSAAGSAVTYTFAAGRVVTGDSITVKADAAKVDVKTAKDGNSFQAVYVPSSTDVNGRTVASVAGAAITGIGVLQIGETTTGTAITAEPGATTWMSSNAAVATVNPTTGVVTALTAGTTTISYTSSTSGNLNSILVTVHAAASVATAPTVPAPATTLATGGAASGNDTAAAGQTLTWYVTPGTGTATINPTTGAVTGATAGDVTVHYEITVDATGVVFSKSAPVTVTIP